MKVGIDLGGSHIAIGLVDDKYNIIAIKEYYMNDRNNISVEEYIIKCINEGIEELLKENNFSKEQIEKIGIATPGNPRNGIIKNVVNLGIKEFNIKAELEKSFTADIKVENDGKCAGLAEKEIGALRSYDDCVFLCVGTGIGGAAFLNGKMLKPKRNSGFEFGHMTIKKDGELCKCGNRGCFEVYCSKRKFKNKILDMLNIDKHIGSEEFTNKVNENMTLEIQTLINDYIENFEIGLANIINILEPEAIAIGGSLSHYSELILDKVEVKIKNGENLFNKQNPPKIVIAEAGNNAGILGATLL